MTSDSNPPHHVDLDEDSPQADTTTVVRQQTEEGTRTPPRLVPEIPTSDLSLDVILGTKPAAAAVQDEKIQKRKSNLLKLNEENEKLKRELQAMTERLEAAERRRAQLQAKGRTE